MQTMKIRIPVVVTADGKWAAQGSHYGKPGEEDWSGIDEACDWDNPTVMPMRLFVEAEVSIPRLETVAGSVTKAK